MANILKIIFIFSQNGSYSFPSKNSYFAPIIRVIDAHRNKNFKNIEGFKMKSKSFFLPPISNCIPYRWQIFYTLSGFSSFIDYLCYFLINKDYLHSKLSSRGYLYKHITILLTPLYLLSRLSLAEKNETLAQAFHTFPLPIQSLLHFCFSKFTWEF